MTDGRAFGRGRDDGAADGRRVTGGQRLTAGWRGRRRVLLVRFCASRPSAVAELQWRRIFLLVTEKWARQRQHHSRFFVFSFLFS